MTADSGKWDPAKLLELSRRLYDGDIVSALHRSISSVGWKLEIAQFHGVEALAAIANAVSNVSDRRREAAGLALLHMGGFDEAVPFADALFISEAHAIAAAQALHSVPDILSNIVYFGLGLGPAGYALTVDKRSLRSVQRIVEKSGIAPTVASALSGLSTSAGFRYLRAYVNTSKHVSLVDRAIGVTVGSTRPERFGLMILPFDYEFRGVVEKWLDKWMEEFLVESLSVVSDSAVEIGGLLEQHVASRAT